MFILYGLLSIMFPCIFHIFSMSQHPVCNKYAQILHAHIEKNLVTCLPKSQTKFSLHFQNHTFFTNYSQLRRLLFHLCTTFTTLVSIISNCIKSYILPENCWMTFFTEYFKLECNSSKTSLSCFNITFIR